MSAPAPTMLDQLRAIVQREGGDWTTGRASAALDSRPTPERARQLLNALTDEGLLIKHGTRGRLWTPPPPVDLATFTEAVLRAVSAIPGVRFAAPVSDQDPGLIGVKVTATDDATYFVQVTR